MKQREQPGYYPGYSTLAQQKHWDEATRALILKRVHEVPPLRFFTPDEAALLEAVVNRVLPQDDRVPERRIPIVPFIDDRLFAGRSDGYRYEDMPHDGEAHRRGLQAIDAIAQHQYGRGFRALGPDEQDAILVTLHDSKPPVWPDGLPVHRYWMLLVKDCAEVYYAHPWAWDEIGFGGPAYPRGYARLGGGEPEPWEVDEERYEWSVDSISDRYTPVEGAKEPAKGQGGTH